MYSEQDLLPLSGIMHFAFCSRQFALIHIEQQWEENLLTTKGHIFHELAHNGPTEKRGQLITSRGLPVFSYALGLRGQCDVVEWRAHPDGVTLSGREEKYLPMPVEYKRGKPGSHLHSDELQLCAQAICLEEMLLCDPIQSAQLYYGETRHRLPVELSPALRDRVRDIAAEMHRLYDRRYTPKVKPHKACRNCSLAEICLPSLAKLPNASSYLETMFGGDAP